MWTYLLGPFLSFLPKRWRKSLFATESIKWVHATFISGLGEFAIAVYAFMYWYSYSVGVIRDSVRRYFFVDTFPKE